MGFELLEMNDDLYSLLNEVIRERDELIKALETEQIMNAELQHEAELARAERDEARRCAEQMRDLYAAEVDESIEAFPCRGRRRMNKSDAWKDGWANALVFIHDAHEWKSQRDEAREAARLFRDLYVSQVGRTYPEEYTLPWEVTGDARD